MEHARSPMIKRWKSAVPLPYKTGICEAAVCKDFLYVLTTVIGSLNVVYYTKINSDGSLAAWKESPHPYKKNEFSFSSSALAVYKNYIYCLGGDRVEISSNGTYEGESEFDTEVINRVLYAQIRDDGSVSSWKETTPLLLPQADHGALVWDEWIYVLAEPRSDSVYFAEIQSDGSLGGWKRTSSLPKFPCKVPTVVHKGRIYVMGNGNVLASEIKSNGVLLIDA